MSYGFASHMCHPDTEKPFVVCWVCILVSLPSGPAMIIAALQDFMRAEVVLPHGRTKVVILDEADNLTEEAQHVIVRYMKVQEVSRNVAGGAGGAGGAVAAGSVGGSAAATTATTFILACNDVSKVIKALQSHCRVFAFACLTPGEVAARVRTVVAAAGLSIDDDAVDTLAGTTSGDMREALAVLQAAACGGLVPSGVITRTHILDSTDKPDPTAMQAILRDVSGGGSGGSGGPDGLDHLMRALHAVATQAADGRDAVNVSSALFQASIGPLDIPERDDLADYATRVAVSSELARCHARVTGGAPTLLQLYGCLSKMWCALHTE